MFTITVISYIIPYLTLIKLQVGELKRGLNPLSFKDLNFDPKYISAPIRAGVITAFIALAVRKLLNYS